MSSRRHARPLSWRRLLTTGLLVAACGGLAGGVLEWWRFGPTSETAGARVEAYVRRDFDRMTGLLSSVATGIANGPAAAKGIAAGPDGARTLFDLVERRAREASSGSDDIAVTIYENGVARAWAGRPSDIRLNAPGGTSTFFVTPSPLGLRLVHVLPIPGSDPSGPSAVAAEHVLSLAPATATITSDDSWVLRTPLGPASLRLRPGDRPRPNGFFLKSPSGEPLIEASVSPTDIRLARDTLRRRVTAVVLTVLGLIPLVLIGPLLDRRALVRPRDEVLRLTAAAMALFGAGALTLWVALVLALGRRPPPPATLIVGGVTAAALMALLVSPAGRLRVAWRSQRRSTHEKPVLFALQQFVAGAIVAGLLVVFEQLLYRAVDPATVDLRHFSLHPLGTARMALLGILACHVASLWTSTIVLNAALAEWRLPAGALAVRARIVLLWVAPSAIVAALATSQGWALPPWGMLASATACAIAALFARRAFVWYRHATVAAGILALFAAFLAPALLLYPSVNFIAQEALRELIATRFAVEARNHPQALQDRLGEAQREIDALAVLPDLVTNDSELPIADPRTDSAFLVWRQTALARARLTSAVELYDRTGTLVSRFALNFPEYTATAQASQVASSCTWNVFGEAAPFGSEERNMLHAERNICANQTPGVPPLPVGRIVVHVMFDYRTLPFITSQSPYFEVFRPTEGIPTPEGTTGSDVDVVIYGWGLGPIYSSGRTAWPISDELFARLYDPSRKPFWTVIRLGDNPYHVYFSNDRRFIYAIGYPALTLFDHLVHLAELTTLAGAVYVVVLLATAVFTRVARARPMAGRALLREIRASFYRKLFLAFVLAAIVPVLILAFVIRAYVATQLLDDVRAEAAGTAAVAQRVIEQSDALQRRGADTITPVSDDLMVWIRQVIDRDVNFFEGPQLVATSQRDLFASGLLPTRTPDNIYRAIALQRLPSFVAQDLIGTFPYTIAAAPVRLGGRDAILTVPLGNRQREIDREIDDLDRGVLLASLFFIMLGAGIGLSMAERIADPVRRLTRATRRIARGEFDEQIAVRSADELQRLVDAFNSMAAELKTQRAQLERTHRLEAWAEMARQVAHEIKNPLTPIQLSAEHLRRVHVDRGEPMGEVLDSCVTSILGQVRLLRQISAEFSNFASSPIAKPAPVDVSELVAEVVDPYRTGLTGRIDIANHVAPSLPRVFVDRTLVARALANIVENALYAMPGPGQLTLDASSDDVVVTVEVRDTGVGMDAPSLARVFEPYFSSKTTGTGLGLPVARRNIELSGGAIEVLSEKGRGTAVRITLPVMGSPDKQE